MTNVATNTILTVSTTGRQTAVKTTPSNGVIQVESNGDVVYVTTTTGSINATQTDTQVETLTDVSSVIVAPSGATGPIGPIGIQGVAPPALTEPVFTYLDSVLTRIDYAGGEYKVLTYSDGTLVSLSFYDGSQTIIKTFNYSNGTLTSITES